MQRLMAFDVDKPIAFACGFIVLILAAGTVYTVTTQGTASFLSPNYLLQQLQVASFLGLVAAGMMMVMAMIVVVIAMRMRTVIMHLAAAATARSGGDVFRCGRCPGRAATAARGVRLFRRAHFQSPTLLHHIPYGGI